MTVNLTTRAQLHLMFGTSCKSGAETGGHCSFPNSQPQHSVKLRKKAMAALRGKLLFALEDNLCRSQTVLRGLWSFSHWVNPSFFSKLSGSFQHLSFQPGKTLNGSPEWFLLKSLENFSFLQRSYENWEGQEGGDGRSGHCYKVNEYKSTLHLQA